MDIEERSALEPCQKPDLDHSFENREATQHLLLQPYTRNQHSRSPNSLSPIKWVSLCLPSARLLPHPSRPATGTRIPPKLVGG